MESVLVCIWVLYSGCMMMLVVTSTSLHYITSWITHLSSMSRVATINNSTSPVLYPSPQPSCLWKVFIFSLVSYLFLFLHFLCFVSIDFFYLSHFHFILFQLNRRLIWIPCLGLIRSPIRLADWSGVVQECWREKQKWRTQPAWKDLMKSERPEA